MTTKLTPADIAKAVLELYLVPRQQRPAGLVDASYLLKHHFPEVSLSTVQRLCTKAEDIGLITNNSYHGGRRDWIPTRAMLITEIQQLRSVQASVEHFLNAVEA